MVGIMHRQTVAIQRASINNYPLRGAVGGVNIVRAFPLQRFNRWEARPCQMLRHVIPDAGDFR